MDKKEYLVFLRKLFALGLQEQVEDPILLSLMTPKRWREAELFTEYLIQRPDSLEELSALSWEEIQGRIQGISTISPHIGPSFFEDYCTKRKKEES